MRDDVRKKLIDVAKKGETITYGELMEEFGIPRGHPKKGIGIGGVLGEITEHEHLNGRPMLSGIVVRAQSMTRICPKGRPGGGILGFPWIPQQLRRGVGAFQDPLSEDDQRFAKDEQEKIWDYWKKHDP